MSNGRGTSKTRLLIEAPHLIREKALLSNDKSLSDTFKDMISIYVTYGNPYIANRGDADAEGGMFLAIQILFSYFLDGNNDLDFFTFQEIVTKVVKNFQIRKALEVFFFFLYILVYDELILTIH